MPVVVGIAGIVAPAVILQDGPDQKPGLKRVNAIRSPPYFPHRKITGGRRPVALFFIGEYAASPQSAFYVFPAPEKLPDGRYDELGIQALRNDSVSPGRPATASA